MAFGKLCIYIYIYSHTINKASDLSSASNYRHISVLHWLSIIFEKAIASRIITFANKNSPFSLCQYWFRSWKSTVHAILKLIEFLYCPLNETSNALFVILDLRIS